MDTFDIEIKEPFDIKIRILEFEERDSSINIQMNYFMVSLQDKIEINNFVWIKYSSWDNFVSQVYNITKGNCIAATLEDMSDNIIFQINQEGQKTALVLHCNKETISGIIVKSSIKACLDKEQLSVLYGKLNSMDKWW